MPSNEIVFLDGARTPFGTFLGTLKSLSATDLGTIAAKEAMKRSNVTPDMIDHTVVGNVMQSSADGVYIGRHVALAAGVPQDKPGYCVNRMCASGFQSVLSGAKEILTGDAEFVLCVGAENMSLAPHVIRNSRTGIGLFQTSMEDSLQSALTDLQADVPMGITAENVAEKWGITRKEQDDFALSSQNKAEVAQKKGNFKNEIIPTVLKSDEHPRNDMTIERLTKLKPSFKNNGTVTPGNASGINDGAAAAVLMSNNEAEKRKLNPLARIVSWATCGVDPSLMGSGPIPASKKALEKAGWKIGDLDLIESNEAFAAQSLAIIKDLRIPIEKVNVNGGAIALGHPIGASGARILVTLLHEMVKRDSKKGLATLCIGGGMGIAMCLERNF